ncbi:hypothetical protein [Paenibacillus nuruki]|uniref:hypothetical protein n=1 Tax=Paenibacillus nuruki TaxID=1886670 RepID=UPI00280487D1|nr:hypothetical protein [Paenibacillus nuruki]CAJ1315896.1 hypothetical protein AASFL403_11785 [Paenibacillus nuruki]
MKVQGKLRWVINILLVIWLLTCFVKWLDWADVQDTYVHTKVEYTKVLLSGKSDQVLQENQAYLDQRSVNKFNQFKMSVVWGCLSIFLLMAAYFIYTLSVKLRKDSVLKRVEVNFVQEEPTEVFNQEQIDLSTKEN